MPNGVTARITGRVQGVAFRHWTKSRAQALGLTGWVRNDVSGAVLAYFHGNRSAVDQMVKDLWAGPGAASVRDVQTRVDTTETSYEDFEIRR